MTTREIAMRYDVDKQPDPQHGLSSMNPNASIWPLMTDSGRSCRLTVVHSWSAWPPILTANADEAGPSASCQADESRGICRNFSNIQKRKCPHPRTTIHIGGILSNFDSAGSR
jgi:hypothetical protein